MAEPPPPLTPEKQQAERPFIKTQGRQKRKENEPNYLGRKIKDMGDSEKQQAIKELEEQNKKLTEQIESFEPQLHAILEKQKAKEHPLNMTIKHLFHQEGDLKTIDD